MKQTQLPAPRSLCPRRRHPTLGQPARGSPGSPGLVGGCDFSTWKEVWLSSSQLLSESLISICHGDLSQYSQGGMLSPNREAAGPRTGRPEEAASGKAGGGRPTSEVPEPPTRGLAHAFVSGHPGDAGTHGLRRPGGRDWVSCQPGSPGARGTDRHSEGH